MNAHEAGLVAAAVKATQELEWSASLATGADEVVALAALQRARGDLYRVEETLDQAIDALETERPEDEKDGVKV